MTDEEFKTHLKRPDSRIHAVFVFPNGMCAVTDQFGQQMPEFQGPWDSALEAKVRAAAGPEAEWNLS